MRKTNDLNQTAPTINFWLCAALLVIVAAPILSQGITRPFYGLHSWGRAHFAWLARSHVKYGLGYTKGFDTFAVGNPPAKNPDRYLDHPQLSTLLDAAAMAVLGINTWSLRMAHALMTIVAILILLKILRGLMDDATALIAGLLFVLFPLTGYFGTYNTWLYPVAFGCLWCYLVLIGGLARGPEPTRFHKLALAILLFLALQLTWEGFFWAFAIGVHYVSRCVRQRQFPNKTLLAILIIAPLSSIITAFVVIMIGRGWDLQGIIEIAKWRAGGGERGVHQWGPWFGRVWEFAILNFSLPVLITAITYLTLGQLLILSPNPSGRKNVFASRRFPHFWLFLMPPVFQLFILKGALWPHQYWERPFAPFVAIAAALGVMVLADILKKIHRSLAVVGALTLIGVIAVFCAMGTKHYYGIRWQPMAKIKMFQMLNKKIPPDKALLSLEPHTVDQHKSKQASYRPEIAWYLDRDVVIATTIDDVVQQAKTDKYPYYLVQQDPPYSPTSIALLRQAQSPNVNPARRKRLEALFRQQRYREILRWQEFINSLKKLYDFQLIEGEQGERTKDGRFLKAGMAPQLIFDLQGKSTKQ